jgi:Zn-dependent protease with chaperone function
MVDFALDEDELAAVLAHEAGRFERRHTIRKQLPKSVTPCWSSP